MCSHTMYVCIQVSFLCKCKLTVVKNEYKSPALALHYIFNSICVIVSSIKKHFCLGTAARSEGFAIYWWHLSGLSAPWHCLGVLGRFQGSLTIQVAISLSLNLQCPSFSLLSHLSDWYLHITWYFPSPTVSFLSDPGKW